MKKFFAIALMFVMVFTMTLSAGAVSGSFIQSPSFNSTPIIVDSENSDSDWKGEIYITSYGDRNVLELIEREKLENAYESIKNSNSVATLIPDIVDIAGNLNVSPDNLGISDLFHIGISEATDDSFKIKLDAETLDNFVGLVYYENGKWYIVDDAFIDGDYLIFTSELPRAFAVVVDVDNSIVDVPVTGDVLSWMLIAVMAASATGIVLLVITYRKKYNA